MRCLASETEGCLPEPTFTNCQSVYIRNVHPLTQNSFYKLFFLSILILQAVNIVVTKVM